MKSIKKKDKETGKLKKLVYEGRLIVLILMAVISIALIKSPAARADEDAGRYQEIQYTYEKGIVLEADDYDMDEDPYVEGIYIGRQNVTVEVLTGEFEGEILSIENTINRKYNYYAREGMDMILQLATRDGELLNAQVFSYSRDKTLYLLIATFVIALIVIGRRKGFYSLLSLIFVLILIRYFMLPAILNGHNPILAAILTAGITTVFNIILVTGANRKAWSAISGILAGLVTATFLSMLFAEMLHLSGINMEHSEEIMRLAQESRLQVKEILFAGIMIASLGAVMDVGMSIASSIFEVYSANSKMSIKELYRSGMNVGRDVMGTMTNTLILAYAGSSLSTLLLFYMYQFPYHRLINIDLLGLELLQGIAGSIGLILTVPITAWISACFAKK